MDDPKPAQAPRKPTHQELMQAVAESSERMNNMTEAERKELHAHALKLVYAAAEMEELKLLKEQLAAAQKRVEMLAKGHERYEFVRTLRPAQFAALFQNNITTGIHFDDLVDRAIAASGSARAGRTET